ncbi:MAG: hypothetical protein ACJAYU_004558 [Bradymonadia bacterium]
MRVNEESVRNDPEFFRTLLNDPFRFYRFINVAFSDAVCVHFADSLGQMPTVNLHGDAHVEQYAVTNVGRGMADYDDSSTGPGVLDLMRFTVSLRLAAERAGLGPEEGDAAVASFFEGYRDGLNDPTFEAPEPALCSTIRDGFATDRGPFLESATGLMGPLNSDDEFELRGAFAAYGERLGELVPEFDDPARFEVVGLGGLDIGIGSRLDRKFLIRAGGETSDPLDDAIIEFKEVRDLSGIRCIQGASAGGAFRVLMGLTRIAQDTDPYLAAVPMAAEGIFAERSFWARSWFDHYVEMNVRESFADPATLEQVAFDVGVQLGIGHVLHIAAPLDAQLRQEQLVVVNNLEGEILAAIDYFTELTAESHARFAADVNAILVD